jgi:hypothetical protein
LTVRVIFIARDQQESMRVTVGELTKAGDLSAIIDVLRNRQLQTGTRRDSRVQVNDRAVFLKECAQELGTVRRTADDLPLRVDAERTTARVALQRSGVSLHATLPEKAVVCLRARQVCGADNLTLIVDPVCFSGVASERSQVSFIPYRHLCIFAICSLFGLFLCSLVYAVHDS